MEFCGFEIFWLFRLGEAKINDGRLRGLWAKSPLCFLLVVKTPSPDQFIRPAGYSGFWLPASMTTPRWLLWFAISVGPSKLRYRQMIGLPLVWQVNISAQARQWDPARLKASWHTVSGKRYLWFALRNFLLMSHDWLAEGDGESQQIIRYLKQSIFWQFLFCRAFLLIVLARPAYHLV